MRPVCRRIVSCCLIEGGKLLQSREWGIPFIKKKNMFRG
jgi:hypothetical protein